MKRKITGKVFLLFLLCTGLMAALSTCKKPDMLFHADGSISGSGLLAGAVFYDGPMPSIGLVTYMDGTQQVTDSAYVGQVIVFFNTPISEEDATEIITSQNGSILGKVPNAGYYFIEVSIGSEGSFINAMQLNTSVYLVCPHIPTQLSSIRVTALDGCDNNQNAGAAAHGQRVSSILKSCGSTNTTNDCLNITDADANVIANTMYENIYKTMYKANNTTTTLINLSNNFGNGYQGHNASDQLLDKLGWKRDIRQKIASIMLMPEHYRKNLIITISAGNGLMPLSDLLKDIRDKDPRTVDILKNNILIVGAKGVDGAYNCSSFSNYLSNPISDATEADVVYMSTCAASDGGDAGTSFSAPQLMCLIQKIMNETGLKASEALHVVKMAAFNNNHIVNDSLVLDIANHYNSACGAQTQSGGSGVTTTTIKTLGSTSGIVTIDYEMYDVPDKMEVIINGSVVASTGGFVSYSGTLSFNYNAASLYYINVVVTGNTCGTAWDYTLNCPQ